MAPSLLTTSSYLPEHMSTSTYNNNHSKYNEWERLLSHFESQPDILHLIQSCRIEEQKRHYEETRTKIKQDHVYHQLENMHNKELFSEKIPEKHLSLRLPPLYQ